jgi:hypothetical protein
MPNIAIGHAQTACAFSLLRAAMLAFVLRSDSIYREEARGQIL